jgi:hypothetical protein
LKNVTRSRSPAISSSEAMSPANEGPILLEFVGSLVDGGGI